MTLEDEVEAVAEALRELPKGTLWAVGSMEEGPFCRLCWPMSNGSYSGGYVEAYGDTPAEAVRLAVAKGKALAQPTAAGEIGE